MLASAHFSAPSCARDLSLIDLSICSRMGVRRTKALARISLLAGPALGDSAAAWPTHSMGYVDRCCVRGRAPGRLTALRSKNNA
jgi:hypothetical protein